MVHVFTLVSVSAGQLSQEKMQSMILVIMNVKYVTIVVLVNVQTVESILVVVVVFNRKDNVWH